MNRWHWIGAREAIKMSDESTTDTERDDSLKNPMRFSIRHRTIDLEKQLRHPDFDEKVVTDIDLRPSEGQVYVHWEWRDVTTDTDRTTSESLTDPDEVSR